MNVVCPICTPLEHWLQHTSSYFSSDRIFFNTGREELLIYDLKMITKVLLKNLRNHTIKLITHNLSNSELKHE